MASTLGHLSEPHLDDDEKLSLSLWLQLMKCTKEIEAGIGGRLRKVHSQSLARFDVLSQLHRFGGDWAAVGEISGRVMASSGNITALVDRMVAEDLIVRRANPDDRRSHQLRMTDTGAALFDEMTADHARWVDDALVGIDDTDKERLIELLINVRRAFEATKNQAQKNQAQKNQAKTGETP
jgi:DNA-binding MarR family transcriptional regulator